MNNAHLSAIIKYLCKFKKITVKSLLETCDINRNFMYDLKSDKKPSVEVLEKIADFFDCSVDYLLGRTDEAGNSTPSDRQIKQLDLSGNELTIVKLFEKLSETQQGELIGRAKLMAEQNDENYMQDGTA